MRVIVIGNGIAGVIFAKTLRELDQNVEIDVYAREKYHYYPRPNLIDFLAERIPFERLFAFTEEWYTDKNIQIHLSQPVKKILPGSQEIELDQGHMEGYDKLVLANGSFSFVPPFQGKDKNGIFTLWSLDDAYRILEYLANHPNVVVIGGGLLGLEIARALNTRGAEVGVVEFFDRLLPRQLDQKGASILQNHIERMGIKVRVGTATEEFLGRDKVSGLRFKGGDKWEADMALIAAGARPNVSLAQEAGLEVDRGLVVNEYLQTSDPSIFGVGDVAQHKGRVYGIIPASFDQARQAAHNVLDEKKKYLGTIPSNTLKVMGVHLTSIGVVNPEGNDHEELRKEIREEGIYKKIVLKEGVIVGAIWMGTKEGVNDITRLITQKTDVSEWKEALLEEPFDFSVL
ncbi:MAG: FAD-dependent oxidoreductase [Candidatus Aminicenantes bacterium]|jgi:nitrite reductase (NADH) large subunit